MSALVLKIIACVTMLIDHVGYCWNITAFRIIGRLAFPIFLFLIYNGYRHTSSVRRYALRLAAFALISQIPFSLFAYNRIFTMNGSVFVSLLLALLCMWAADGLQKRFSNQWVKVLPFFIAFCLYTLNLIRSDHGANAILLAFLFTMLDEKTAKGRILILCGAALTVLHPYLLRLGLGLVGLRAMPVLSRWQAFQGFSLLAYPLIFAYNGQKGPIGSKLVQYGFYAFYPVHLLVLWLICIA